MDDNPENINDAGNVLPPSKKSHFVPLCLNGRTYSLRHSYRLQQEEREKKLEECAAKAKAVCKIETQVSLFYWKNVEIMDVDVVPKVIMSHLSYLNFY